MMLTDRRVNRCTQKASQASPAHIMPAKEKGFFIAIDSDGCVFDTMEIKHKECFCPAAIKHFHLQAVSRYARETWEFVNLYSRQRGTNRFPALVSVLDFLRVRPEVIVRSAAVPELVALRHWIGEGPKLDNPALHQAALCNPALKVVLDWSAEVNERVADMVHGVPPFPTVRHGLERASSQADMIVSSGTPLAALHREWKEHGLAGYVRRIAGQEDGTKTQHLTAAAQGRYPPDRILMVGDAPGDLRAARNVNAFFFPILPGREEDSWQQFCDEALDRFLSGCYGGSYQESLIATLEGTLPVQPPWTRAT